MLGEAALLLMKFYCAFLYRVRAMVPVGLGHLLNMSYWCRKLLSKI